MTGHQSSVFRLGFRRGQARKNVVEGKLIAMGKNPKNPRICVDGLPEKLELDPDWLLRRHDREPGARSSHQ